jgi:hypothetical protein
VGEEHVGSGRDHAVELAHRLGNRRLEARHAEFAAILTWCSKTTPRF